MPDCNKCLKSNHDEPHNPLACDILEAEGQCTECTEFWRDEAAETAGEERQ